MRRTWSLLDSRGRCLHVGTVEADSDSEAVKVALAGSRRALQNARIALDPKLDYRVKSGSALAAVNTDDLEATAAQIGSRDDGAAEGARTAKMADEVRARAERELRDVLRDRVRARTAEKALAGDVVPTRKTLAGDGTTLGERFKVGPVKARPAEAWVAGGGGAHIPPQSTGY